MRGMEASRNLEELRERISSVDEALLKLLAERLELAKAIGKAKRDSGTPHFLPEREQEVLERALKFAPSLPQGLVRDVFRALISHCRAVQERPTFACLGPEGSFSEQALRGLVGDEVEVLHKESVEEVFSSLSRGEIRWGIVPIENSIGGTVLETLDSFLRAAPSVRIRVELSMEVELVLASEAKSLEEIEEVRSHPQALSQSRNWLSKNLPRARRAATNSTSAAAAEVKGNRRLGAICSRLAARTYGLEVLASHVEDNPGNVTRFWLISTEEAPNSRQDKTSILFNVPHRPGTLFRALKPLYEAKLNLTHIQSRPMPGSTFEYIFFVDFEGGISEERVRRALEEMRALCSFLKVLGSYPVAR